MKKKLLYLLFPVLFLILLVSCGEAKTPVPTLKLSGTEFAEALKGSNYTHEGVAVTAIYDKSRLDVTSYAEFSALDTSTLGKKTVTVTYETATASYEVDVVEELSDYSKFVVKTANAKKIYYEGEEFSKDGLVVVKDKVEKLNYDVLIYDAQDNRVGTTFNEAGKYTITIKSGTDKLSYSVMVLPKSLDSKTTSNFDNAVQADKLVDGKLTLSELTTIYNKSNITLEASVGSVYKKLEATVLTKTANSCIEIGSGNSIDLTTKEQAELMLVVTGDKLSADSEGIELKCNEYDGAYIYNIVAEPGEYSIKSTGTSAIYLVDSKEIPVSSYTYSNFSIDTSAAAKQYGKTEIFTDFGVSITAKRSDGKTVTLSLDNFVRTITHDAVVVNSISTTGTYKVTYTFKNDTSIKVSYEFEVINEKYVELSYEIEESDLSFEDEDFSYETLKVYGVTPSKKKELLTLDRDYIVTLTLNDVDSVFYEDGTYTAKIFYTGNYSVGKNAQTTTYDVTYKGTKYDSISVDSSNAQKLFYSGVGFNANGIVVKIENTEGSKVVAAKDYTTTLMYNGQVVRSFDKTGTYVVKVSYTGNHIIDISETSYQIQYVGEFDKVEFDTSKVQKLFVNEPAAFKDLKAYLCYGTEKIETTDFTTVYEDSSGTTLMSVTSSGTYKVKLQYVGICTIKGAKTGEYDITYYASTSEVVYTAAEVDTQNAMTEFASNIEFNSNNIVVYGKINTVQKRVLADTEYQVELLLNGNVVTGFTDYSKYTVRVTIPGGVSTTYQVEYLSPYAVVTFGYSGTTKAGEYDGVKTYNVYPTDNPADYIKVPSGTIFTGFSQTFETLEPGKKSYIKVYVVEATTGKITSVFLNSDYTLGEKVLSNSGDALTTTFTPTTIPDGSTFVGYGLTADSKATVDACYLPIFKSNTATTEIPVLEAVNRTTVKVELPLNGGKLNSSDVALYDGATKIADIGTASKLVAVSTEGKNYTLKGSYSIIKNNVITDVTLTESSVDTTSASLVFDSLSFDASAVNKTIIGTAVTSAGLKVYGVVDSIKTELSDYEIKYYDSTSALVETISENGEYKAKISYTGTAIVNSKEIGEYTITYFKSEADVKYSKLALNTQNVKLAYENGDTISYEGLKVNAVYTSGKLVELDSTRYQTELVYNGTPVNAFSSFGKYTVRVTANGAVASYEVEYKASVAKVRFMYSGMLSSDTGYYDTNTDYINVKATDNPVDYIKIPSDYLFCGFSDDLSLLPAGSHVVKIYVIKNVSGKKTSAFLDWNYTYGTTVTTNDNQVITNSFTPRMQPSGYTFVSYGLATGATATTNKYYLPIFETTATSNADITAVIESATSIKVSLPLFGGTLESSQVALYDGTTKVADVNTKTKQITGLSANQYTLKGSYKFKSDLNVITTIEINENIVDLSLYSALDSSVDKTSIAEKVFADGFAANIETFVTNSPENYELSGFIVTDSTGEIVQDIEYTTGMKEIYVTSLNAGDTYSVSAYYDYNGPVTTLTSYSKAKNGLTYRFYYVGFMVQVTGKSNYHRVRMLYDGFVLYTWYIEHNSSVSNPYSFTLPVEYEDCEIAGSYEDLSKITADKDVDLVLIKKVEESPFTVIYYDRTESGLYKIYSIQKVEAGNDAIVPDYVPERYFSSNGDYSYTFVRWSDDNKNIIHTMKMYPRYDATLQKAPYLSGSMDVYSTKAKISSSLSYSNTISEIEGYLVDTNGKKIPLYSNMKEYDEFYKDRMVTELTPNMTYTYTIDFKYDLKDGNGVKSKTETKTFKTVASNATANANLKVTATTKDSVTLTFTKNALSYVHYEAVGKDNYLHSCQIWGYTTTQTINSLSYQNAKYNMWTGTYDNTNKIYYIYENDLIEFTTQPAASPVVNGFMIKYVANKGIYFVLDGTNDGKYTIEILVNYTAKEAMLQNGYHALLEYNESFKAWACECPLRCPVYDTNNKIVDYYDSCIEMIELRYTYDKEYTSHVYLNYMSLNYNDIPIDIPLEFTH